MLRSLLRIPSENGCYEVSAPKHVLSPQRKCFESICHPSIINQHVSSKHFLIRTSTPQPLRLIFVLLMDGAVSLLWLNDLFFLVFWGRQKTRNIWAEWKRPLNLSPDSYFQLYWACQDHIILKLFGHFGLVHLYEPELYSLDAVTSIIGSKKKEYIF